MKEKLRFLGMDVHAETIATAIAEPDGDVRSLGTIPNRMESIRKLLKRLGPLEKTEPSIEAWDVIGMIASSFNDSGKVAPDRNGKASSSSAHPETAAAAYGSIGAHFAEGGIDVDRVGGPLGQPCQGEQRMKCADEDVSQLVHRSSY
jgi:hypothetical protein